ncbi:MAG: hypothetical protein KGL35_23315, partial [Bradyrhizobium sp.]|nr:hypothetical protein [Bradyrhizobium sp.]
EADRVDLIALIIEHWERNGAPIKPLDAIDATRYLTDTRGYNRAWQAARLAHIRHPRQEAFSHDEMAWELHRE